MAPPASYSHFEGATDDADPMARQPWGELTPNLRHVANPDVDVDITGQQEPVDVHAQDQSSLHHASDNYRNLCYFNSWQEALLGAPPDPTTHSTGTPWMPLGQNMSMSHSNPHPPIVTSNAQAELLPAQYSTNSQFDYFMPWQEPLFSQPIADTSNSEAGRIQNFEVDDRALSTAIDVDYAPQCASVVQNPSEPHLYFDRRQEPTFLPPSISNVRAAGPSHSTSGLDNEVAANGYYSEAHEYNFSSFTADHVQGQVPSQESSSSLSHPSYASLWPEPLAPLPGPDIHPSATPGLPFGLYHHAEHHVSGAEAHTALAHLQADHSSGTTGFQYPSASSRSPKPTSSLIEGSGQPSTPPIAGSSEARFSCTFCPSVFTAKHNLKYHMQAHRGERPHRCDTCGSVFGRGSDLKRHKRSKKHLDALQFQSGEPSRLMEATS